MKRRIYFKEWKNPGLGMASLTLAWNERGICRVIFGGKNQLQRDAYLKKNFAEAEFVEARQETPVVEAFQEYLQAGGGDFSQMKFDLHGSPFQQKVWKAIARIPRGETLTYGEIAKKIGIPRGPRAIGLACGQNPVPLAIPCHRVVGAGKSLGGFTAGLKLKKTLLAHEGIQCP